ncbi:thermonuclease family protein [Thalassospira sp. TSL5-1]|uniref:thermonuclease family protein n=1 Tax=Thalassospira sp. TSL5-1 TaxID=1544451 RepID=UPI00093EE8B3|nr:thermonuclease family protein [Thalassospira sp. TSL5-1]OKH87107.1 nuclease [Thalassospira sp. TSL5-1]
MKKPICRTIIAAALGLGSILPARAHAACYDWPLRQRGGEYAYDGDTIYVLIPGLPGEIAQMSVRVRGVDTPEIRGKCTSEKQLASKARDYARQSLKQAKKVEFCEPEWGRYGGRVVASVRIDGRALDQELISAGLARPYDGKTKRAPWCG